MENNSQKRQKNNNIEEQIKTIKRIGQFNDDFSNQNISPFSQLIQLKQQNKNYYKCQKQKKEEINDNIHEIDEHENQNDNQKFIHIDDSKSNFNSLNSNSSKKKHVFGTLFNQDSFNNESQDKLIRQKQISPLKSSIKRENVIIKKQEISSRRKSQNFDLSYRKYVNPFNIADQQIFQSDDQEKQKQKNDNSPINPQEKDKQDIAKKKQTNKQQIIVFTKKNTYYQAYNKLFNFKITQKNSSCLIYDKKLGTIVPKFPCKHCGTKFQKASSLGGHVSKCKMKKVEIEFPSKGVVKIENQI